MDLSLGWHSGPVSRGHTTIRGKPAPRVVASSTQGKATGRSKGGAPSTGAASKKKKPPKPKKPPRKTALEVVTAFVQKAEERSNLVLVGIDPGTTGAIAFKCHKFYCVVDIPRTETKRKKTRRTSWKERKATGKKSKTVMGTDREPDLDTIIKLFRLLKPVKDRVRVILEKIPPTIGKRGRKYAEIMLNRAYAMWPLFLTSKGYELHQEKPGVWKAQFGLLGADKEDDRKLARKLYPEADILRVKDHDRADALLLVEYLQRKLEKKLK